ncbi:MAG: 4Fe-4S binding protein [bacterium]|nr:4Fe-4S binding protein [bacterium]
MDIIELARTPKSPVPGTAKGKVYKGFWTARHITQLAFAALNVWLGIEFWWFVRALEMGGDGPLTSRPAGVEAWLPISGLMGVIDWFARGQLNLIHPASAILVLCFIAMAFLARKAFCAWVCPVGTLSEGLALLGRKLFKRNFLLPRWLDYPLMSLKYILLGLFLSAFVMMGTRGMAGFMNSPYNQLADVKMLLFFVEIGVLGLVVLAVLMIGSIFVEGFWCRYWCPYGAMLGLFSWASPLKIRRNTETCIDCDRCTKACPSRLPVAAKLRIISPECTGCLRCETACPIKECITLGPTPQTKVNARQLALIVAGVFLVFVLTAKLTGVWDSTIRDEEYRYHFERRDNAEYGHPGQ